MPGVAGQVARGRGMEQREQRVHDGHRVHQAVDQRERLWLRIACQRREPIGGELNDLARMVRKRGGLPRGHREDRVGHRRDVHLCVVAVPERGRRRPEHRGAARQRPGGEPLRAGAEEHPGARRRRRAALALAVILGELALVAAWLGVRVLRPPHRLARVRPGFWPVRQEGLADGVALDAVFHAELLVDGRDADAQSGAVSVALVVGCDHVPVAGASSGGSMHRHVRAPWRR
mmetsp:Transcript_76222/g.233230  ORF Transcript_76222/g.233230 Transcript_76222/m.233230 type:complete len:232 (-) Transcript_76222:439-1134(-)